MISILAESLNMQMESENSDLLDRNMMALYGMREDMPSKIDQFGPEMAAKLEASMGSGGGRGAGEGGNEASKDSDDEGSK